MDGVVIKKNGEPVMQLSVMLQNKVGALSALFQLIRSNGETIIGLSVQDAKDATMVRLILTDPEKISLLFREKGIPYTTCNMVVIAMRDASVEMAKCLQILHSAETNVDFAYSLLARPDGRCLMALHLCDYIFGSDILRSAGMRVLYQEDISR